MITPQVRNFTVRKTMYDDTDHREKGDGGFWTTAIFSWHTIDAQNG